MSLGDWRDLGFPLVFFGNLCCSLKRNAAPPVGGPGEAAPAGDVGQQTQRKYPDGTRTTWVYDPVGNPLIIAAPAGTFIRTYDSLDQVRQLQWPTGEILTWTYDAAGNRQTRETSLGTTTYLFDANAQLTKLENEHEEVTTFSYDAVGREVLKELDNGTSSTIVYDAAGQTVSVANRQENDDIISRFTYLYDPAGNRLHEFREDSSQKLWTYDPTNQLISEEIADGVGITRTTYVYDPVGNRLVLNADGELTTSTYDAANRLQTAEEISGITTYTFDASGNQRTIETPSGEITTFSWSFENQLVQIEEPDDVVTTQVYAPVTRNSDELRLSKETDVGVTNFIWDNQNIIREVDDTNSVDAEYTLNPQPYGNLVSQHRDAESTFYNYDALGSTESLTDQAGTKSDEYRYSAFGKIIEQTGSTENNYTWVGELGYYQNPDGSYTLRRRDYTAEENRFRSEDPTGSAAGDENQYRYAANSPSNVVDPSGLAGMIQFGGKAAPGAVEFVWDTSSGGFGSIQHWVNIGGIDAYSCVSRLVSVPPSRRAEFDGKSKLICKVHYNELVDWANGGLIPTDETRAAEVIDKLFLDRCKQNQGAGCTRNPPPAPPSPPAPDSSAPEGAFCPLSHSIPFPPPPDPDTRDLHDQLLDCPGQPGLTPGCFPRALSKAERDELVESLDVVKSSYSLITSMLPGLGDLKEAIEAWYAKDIITGEEFGRLETAIVRAFALLPIVPNSVLRKISGKLLSLLGLLSSKLRKCPRGERLAKWLDDVAEWLKSRKLTKAADRLGVDLSNLTIVNGRARLRISFAQSLTPSDIAEIRKELKCRGATSAIIETGTIINEKLRDLLIRFANSGKLYLGGKVSIAEQHGQWYAFEVLFDPI